MRTSKYGSRCGFCATRWQVRPRSGRFPIGASVESSDVPIEPCTPRAEPLRGRDCRRLDSPAILAIIQVPFTVWSSRIQATMLQTSIAIAASICFILSTADRTFPQGTSKPVAWLEDFAQLKHEMAAHYANLDWAIAERHIDLKRLSEQTQTRLREARNEAQARHAVESFLQAFGDGHLSVRWPRAEKPITNEESEKPSSQSTLCTRLGFHEQRTSPGIAFSCLHGFEQLTTPDSTYFPIGALILASGARVGLFALLFFRNTDSPTYARPPHQSLACRKPRLATKLAATA